MPAIRIARVVRSSPLVTAVDTPITADAYPGSIAIDVLGARITVPRGADRATLDTVLDTLVARSRSGAR